VTPGNPTAAASEPFMSDASAEATAYHEAGHAVMALALGRPVDRVSIRPSKEQLGVCHFRKPVFRPSEDWVEREMLIALAGLAAEAKFTGTYAWEEADRDRRYAAGLARERAGNAKQAERLERRLLAKAEHLLSQDGNWRAVERLAAELLRQGEISGRAARHLFEECQRNAE
jgi:ATP-dependent Zn protease